MCHFETGGKTPRESHRQEMRLDSTERRLPQGEINTGAHMELAELFNYYIKGVGTATVLTTELKSPDAIVNQLSVVIMEYSILLEVMHRNGLQDVITEASKIYDDIKTNIDALHAELRRRATQSVH
jgi:hypothetical protein